MKFRFYFDVVCPYAYMAASQVEQLAAAYGTTVEWCPVLLGGIFRHHESPDIPAASWAPARAVVGHTDLHRMAELHGLPLRFPDAHPRRTVDAMRLCTVAPSHQRGAVARSLFEAIWLHNEDPASPAVLQRIATRFGIDPDQIRAAPTRHALRAHTRIAAESGVFGVPTMQVVHSDGRVGPLHWGADRMHFVAGELAGSRVPQTLPVTPVRSARSPRTLQFFHDFASPYSYLGATQVGPLAAQADTTVRWRPILLGAVFRSIGTPNVPLFAMQQAKQRWYMAELDRWADHHGVPFQFPSTFPVRTVLPLRVSLVAPEATMPLYRALWAENRDIGQPGVVADVLRELGHSPEAIFEAAGSAPIKAQLRANGDAAIEAGVCGVPSFLVDQTHLVWGQDRLPVVEQLLAGWSPTGAAR